MQPIERYALVTLLFLVVLVVVGALWDDGEVPASGGPAQEIARAESPAASPAAAARRRRSTERPPLNMREPAAEVSRQRTTAPQRRGASESAGRQAPRSGGRAAQGAPSYVAPGRSGAGRTVPGALADQRPAAPSAEDLAGALRREPVGNAPSGYLNARGLTRDLGRAREGSGSAGLRPATPEPSGDRAAPAPAPKTRAYTIQSGDSLARIAKRELGDTGAVDRIASLNGLAEPYTIYSGRTLQLPVAALQPASTPSAPTSAAREASAQAPRATGGRATYTVRPGDSLSLVLEREFGTSKRSLPLVKTLNPGLDPNAIRPGMRIILPRADEVPGGVSVASRPVAPSAGPATVQAQPSTRREFVVR
ncbi:MAG: LysM peptidoglycan-binding domain-containing protein [Planctomycetota bacterium]|nr:LysM peptidoglycan-binding domain-containing protein [Planctomycetota bacterium]MDG1983195.1 LysM peptidoglycan-binding domain-containing protein [Planctomycetota bacterium]